MGYEIAEVSKELDISSTAIIKKIKEKDFKNLVYKKDGITYIKEEGIRKLPESINAIDLDSEKEIIDEKNRKIEFLNIEIDYLKKQIEFYKKDIKDRDNSISSLESKLLEMKVIENRCTNIEGKIVSNVRENLVKRSEKHKKKKWFFQN